MNFFTIFTFCATIALASARTQQFGGNSFLQQNPFFPNQDLRPQGQFIPQTIQSNQNQNQLNNALQQAQTTTPTSTSSNDIAQIQASREYILCNINCPSVNQYNPICGTDGTTYNNEFKLNCANDCGRESSRNWQEITATRRGACSSGQKVA